MGIHLEKFGQQVVRIAQEVADHLGNSVVSPPAPVLLGVAAVCFGAAAVKHVRRTNCKPRKQQLTPRPEVHRCSSLPIFCLHTGNMECVVQYMC